MNSRGTRRFPKKIAPRGHLRDKRFNTILHQGLGKVAESLAKRLLIAEGFDVKDFSFNVSSYIAGVRYAGSMGQSKRAELWEELLEERGPIFADHRVKEFVDDLIEYKKIKGNCLDLGARDSNIVPATGMERECAAIYEEVHGDDLVRIQVGSGPARFRVLVSAPALVLDSVSDESDACHP